MGLEINTLYDRYFPNSSRVLKVVIPKFPTFNDVDILKRDNFEQDSFFSVVLGNLIIKVLAKKTPYTNFPLECMLYIHRENGEMISQITDFTNSELDSLNMFLGKFLVSVRNITFQSIVLSVNQQPGCVNIPQKFDENGVEVKVQTIDNFHMHIFSDGRLDGVNLQFSDLDIFDKQDFFDIYAREILGEEFILRPNSALYYSSRFGFGSMLQKLFAIHEYYSELYDKYVEKSTTDPGSELQEMFGRLIARNVEVDPKFYPVLGTAFTCVVLGDNKLQISPRVISRGNAMEAQFIWVDQSDMITEYEIRRRVSIYKILIHDLKKEFEIIEGPLLHSYG